MLMVFAEGSVCLLPHLQCRHCWFICRSETDSVSQFRKVTFIDKSKQGTLLSSLLFTDRQDKPRQRENLPQCWIKCRGLLAHSKVKLKVYKSRRLYSKQLVSDWFSCRQRGLSEHWDDHSSHRGVSWNMEDYHYCRRCPMQKNRHKLMKIYSGHLFGHYMS